MQEDLYLPKEIGYNVNWNNQLMIYLNDMSFKRKKAEEFIFSFKLYDLHVSVTTY